MTLAHVNRPPCESERERAVDSVEAGERASETTMADATFPSRARDARDAGRAWLFEAHGWLTRL